MRLETGELFMAERLQLGHDDLEAKRDLAKKLTDIPTPAATSNVVFYHGCGEMHDEFYLFKDEPMSSLTLEQLLSQSGTLHEDFVKLIVRQVIDGLLQTKEESYSCIHYFTTHTIHIECSGKCHVEAQIQYSRLPLNTTGNPELIILPELANQNENQSRIGTWLMGVLTVALLVGSASMPEFCETVVANSKNNSFQPLGIIPESLASKMSLEALEFVKNCLIL
jgi:hypothetical protein